MFRSLRNRTVRIIAPILMTLRAASAAAQDYPSRPITFIVAFAPGGFADSVARLIGSKLNERLGRASSSRTAREAEEISAPPRQRRLRPTATRCW